MPLTIKAKINTIIETRCVAWSFIINLLRLPTLFLRPFSSYHKPYGKASRCPSVSPTCADCICHLLCRAYRLAYRQIHSRDIQFVHGTVHLHKLPRKDYSILIPWLGTVRSPLPQNTNTSFALLAQAVVYYDKRIRNSERPYTDYGDDYMSEHPDSIPDEALAQMARVGDKAAFDTLCDRYLPVVYNRLRAKLPPEAVEDVTQQVFIGAMKGIKYYRERSSFRTWILSIARHKIADYYRSHSRQPETVPLDLGNEGEADGSERRDTWEEQVLVRITLERIPDHYQEILLLRFAEGMRFQKIARTLDISLEAAKSRYRRAVAAIAKEMETEI